MQPSARENVRIEIAERIRLAADAMVPGPPDPPITSPNFPAADRERLLAEADKLMPSIDAYVAAEARALVAETAPAMLAPRTLPLAEKAAGILADAKWVRCKKFVDAAFALHRGVTNEQLREHIVRELAAKVARGLVEQGTIREVLARDEVPSRGPGYDYSVELVFLTVKQLEELSRLNREIRRGVDDRPAAHGPEDAPATTATTDPAEAPAGDFWRWRFPRPGRYYAQGRYVDVATANEERDLPPGYVLWVTAEGVRALRLDGGGE